MAWAAAIPWIIGGLGALGSFFDQKSSGGRQDYYNETYRDPGFATGPMHHGIIQAMDLLHGGGAAAGPNPWGFMQGMGGIFNDPELAALMGAMHQGGQGDRTAGFEIDRLGNPVGGQNRTGGGVGGGPSGPLPKPTRDGADTIGPWGHPANQDEEEKP